MRNTDPRSSIVVQAAPLKPYQPNHNMNTPSAPRGMLCPGNAFTFTTLPFSSLTNLPIRGPSILAPMIAEIPPTICIQHEPAKSWKPNCANQPPPHIQCASIGYTSADITPEYTQYERNFVLSAIAPDTIVAVVAQNTKLNTKLEKSKLS